MNIRDQIDQHIPIEVESAGSGRVAVSMEDFRALVDLAHTALHGPDPEDDENDFERGYDETQLRNNALHLAASVAIASIQASHGLDSEQPDIVGYAEAYLSFLKGGDL